MKTNGGFSADIIDFTTWQSSVPIQAPSVSMIVAIVALDGRMAFVKVTGAKEILLKNKDEFTALVQSLNQENRFAIN